MKTLLSKWVIGIVAFMALMPLQVMAQDFQGKAYYYKKTKMELGKWGATLSEQQKKQIEARLKNRLEKSYVLTFNKEMSIYKEMDKLDAMSGATDSWGKNFSPGTIYKNIKTNTLIQSQEFYGKRFLVKDSLQTLEWKMESATKKIGDHTCFKATCEIPVPQFEWWSFSWSKLRNKTTESNTETSGDNEHEDSVDTIAVEAWYTPQIPVGQGPLEYTGLPGLILELSAGNTMMLCSKIVINPKEKINIEAPDKGKLVTKKEYVNIVTKKMQEFRDNRGRRRY